MWRFGRCSLLPNYTSLLRSCRPNFWSERSEEERESLACPSFFFCLIFLMGHSIIIVHSSFFFRPDLDLCGLPAWLLPWQHLEPNSSCWPYVFTEARACSSLLHGFASPSKVSSYRLTKTLLTGRISIIVSFTLFWFLPLSHSVSQSLTKSRTHPRIHPQHRLCFLFIHM